MSEKRICWPLLLVFAFASLSCQAMAQESRTWRSGNGKFSIEATFEKVEDGVVFLRSTNGKKVEVPLTQLSEADQDYANSQSGNPFKISDGDNKKSDSAQPPKEIQEEISKTWSPSKGDKIKINWKNSWYPGVVVDVLGPDAYRIHYDNFSDTWDETVPLSRLQKPGSVPSSPAAPGKTGPRSRPQKSESDSTPSAAWADTENSWKPIDLTDFKFIPLTLGWNLPVVDLPPPKQARTVAFGIGAVNWYFQRPLIVSKDNKTMFMSEGYSGQQKGAKLVAVDIEKGKVLGTAQIPVPKSVLRDVSADGKILLTSSDTFFPKENRFDLWEINKQGKLLLLKSVRVATQVQDAKFVFDGRVALIDEEGSVSIWGLKSEPKALYRTENLGRQLGVRVAPDGQHLFLSNRQSLIAIDTESGTCVSNLKFKRGGGNPVAVHPSRSQIAVGNPNRISIFDSQGNQTADFYVPSSVIEELHWVDDRYLDTGNTIVDTKLKIELAAFKKKETDRFKTDTSGACWVYDGVTKLLGTTPVRVEQLKDKKPANFESVFNREQQIALKFQGSFSASDRDEMEKLLGKILKDRGFILNSSAPNQFLVGLTSSSESKKYQDQRNGGQVQMSFNKWKFKLALEIAGKELVSRTASFGGAPSLVLSRNGETLQQAGRRENKERRPGVDDFNRYIRGLDLPQTIIVHPKGKPFFELQR